MTPPEAPPIYISVDVETDGPIPGDYSMLALGCVAGNTEEDELEIMNLRPISDRFDRAHLAMGPYDIDQRYRLATTGIEPRLAMYALRHWLETIHTRQGRHRPLVFTGNNAPFDWMFVCWYLWHFTGGNPFGHAALDIRSYAMGVVGCDWDASSLKRLPGGLGLAEDLPHWPLADAGLQQDCFWRLRRYRRELTTA